VASGKGGTGKTTIAINLALTIARQGTAVTYADCDVENPNGHIFLNPQIERVKTIGVPRPEVDHELCSFCGDCAEICQYGAIASLPEATVVYPELCHGCGGCQLVCPTGAISEIEREIGKIEFGSAAGVAFVGGRLRIGEAQSPPLIREVKRCLRTDEVCVIDSPPGTSCPVIEAVKKTDFVILVTEPTPFGLNDLKLAVGMLKVLQLPFGVVINRADIGNRETKRYCTTENIEVLLEIPEDRGIAEAYSRGVPAVDIRPELTDGFARLFDHILNMSEKTIPQVSR
jgi:MinD superfamily P-loop ATPase